MVNPNGRSYWYRFIVYNNTENGMATPTIACVEGMLYSKAHFDCKRITGGPGRGHLRTSFIPCPGIEWKILDAMYILSYLPMYITIVHTNTTLLPTAPSTFQNQNGIKLE